MDVRLSAEQEALRDSAVQLVDKLAPRAVGEIGDPDRVATLGAAVTESGWRELRSGTDSGVPLASGVETAIVAEELGRGLADTPFLGPTLAADLRRMAGAPPCDVAETVALDAGLTGIAQATGDGAMAIDARGSAQALLLVVDAGGHRLARVPLGGGTTGVDLTRPTVALDSSTVVTPLEGAHRPLAVGGLRRWVALGLSLTCADLVGAMRGAVELSCAYASQRRQFGAAIGSFQAIQHMLADAHVATEGSRSVTLHAAWAVDALSEDEALAAAAAAKAYCARAAREVCEIAIQVHGGMGNTWECLAHVFLRRALLSSDVLGDERVNLARVLDHQGIGGRHGLR